MIDNNTIDSILERVEKPGRYCGGEFGAVVKDHSKLAGRFAFCFPDMYEIGMSHLGLKILYGVVNEMDDWCCERVFAPWSDLEKELRTQKLPLFSLESRTPVCEFDVVGFTLQYEMSYTNILMMLELSGIPLIAAERGENNPVVCAGGPCGVNPEPMSDFFDFYMIGDGEELLPSVLNVYRENKEAGGSRADYLKKLSSLRGIYVPSLYTAHYDKESGKFLALEPKENVPKVVKKAIVQDFDTAFYPKRTVVPNIEAIHDRVMLELFRGCSRGCRFCQAGYIYRPLRERRPETLAAQGKALLEYCGYDEISLTSLSSSDYSGLDELYETLLPWARENDVNMSLPSLRADNFSKELARNMQSVRRSGLTFAPEAGTQRLRDVINKNITEEDIISACKTAAAEGFKSVKLYFMIGHPTETDEDILGIARMAKEVSYQMGGARVTVGVSPFVPKPHTPFQWCAQISIPEIERRIKLLTDNMRHRKITLNWHDPQCSFLEAVISRGDRRLGRIILTAYKLGCRFDSWGEYFSYDKWMQAFEKCRIDPKFYADRAVNPADPLPWDHIDTGASKAFLANEYKLAFEGKTTHNCREGCVGCGAASLAERNSLCPIIRK